MRRGKKRKHCGLPADCYQAPARNRRSAIVTPVSAFRSRSSTFFLWNCYSSCMGTAPLTSTSRTLRRNPATRVT